MFSGIRWRRSARTMPVALRRHPRPGPRRRRNKQPGSSARLERHPAPSTNHCNCLASRFASTQPGTAPAGAAGSSSNHPTGAPAMIRLMPMPSIIPPTREPITPEARPRYSMSPRLIMTASQPCAAGLGKDRPAGTGENENLTIRPSRPYRPALPLPGTWTDPLARSAPAAGLGPEGSPLKVTTSGLPVQKTEP
jgi:hypothetical protein